MPRPFFLIVNPAAGAGRGRPLAERALRALRERGAAVELMATTAEADVERLAAAARAEGAPAVLVAGGDGTLRAAAQALAGGDTPLVPLPCGRGNDFARALGVGSSPERAALAALDGATRRVDLGRLAGSEQRFLTVATCGLDAEVSAIVHRREVPFRGTLGYLLATLRALARYRPLAASIEGDFGRLEGEFLLIATANTSSYGGGMRICPDARPDDGLLDVCAVRALPTLEVLRMLPRVFRGRHVRHPAVTMLRTRGVRIATAGPASVYADGEPLAQAPVELAVEPGALPVKLAD